MLTISCWKWGNKFEARHVNILRSMLARHVHADHRLICITDNPQGLDADIITAPIEQFADTPRCRRRMKQFDRAFANLVGSRFLTIDLDVVIVDDMTAILTRREPFVGWRVKHAQVFSGSFVMMNTGLLHDLYTFFAQDPTGFPKVVQPQGMPSDQAMLNYYMKHYYRGRLGELTEEDGFVTYFGAGYSKLEHSGVGQNHPDLPRGARIVVLGSADLNVLDQKKFAWVEEHWN